MPEISRFFGIVIAMYYDDHNPPHFHAKYGKYKAVFSIDSLTILEGKLPSRVAGFVYEWGLLHKKALLKNWELAVRNHVPNKIKPLV